MKTFKIFGLAVLAASAFFLASCSEANEYEDWNSSNPSWVENWNESTTVTHPATLTGTTWSRTAGLKTNAYGEDVQGFVESVNFITEDSCAVKMSEPVFPASWADNTAITWTDESNTEQLPRYEYTYSEVTGKVEILKPTVNDKGAVSKKTIFTGIAAEGTKTVLTVIHIGDIPVQTYLTVK